MERDNVTVCAVDDDPRNIQLIGNILENNGYDPAVFLSGEQLFLYLEKETTELILLDIMMPEMDGLEVCEKLKKNFSLKDIPVIFITAKTDTVDLVKGFEVGAVDYITKPFEEAELLVRIKTHLDLKWAREEIDTLRGLLPLCANCKKIRDDNGIWERMETYIEQRSDAKFTHSICPECIEELYGKDKWLKIKKRME